MPRSAGGKKVTVRNVGGVRDATFELQPGINVLRGPNGSGKTSVLRAVSRALGGGDKIEARDGAGRGEVHVAGVSLSVKSVVRSSGQAELSLADSGPIARAIDPGIDDPEKANAARLKAILEMVPLPATEERIRQLAGDDEIAEAVLLELKDGRITDLLTASERCRLVAHAAKRLAADRAERMRGAVAAAKQREQEAISKLGGEDLLVAVTAAQAEALGHEAVRRLEVARVARQGRVELEARQAEARKAAGDVPDPTRYDADIALRQAAVAAHQKRVEDLLEQVARERELLGGVVADLEGLRRARNEEAKRLAQHGELGRILSIPVEGPTAEEVESLETALGQTKDLFRAARLSDEVRAAREQVAALEADLQQSEARSEALGEVARTVGERIGDLLSELGLEGFTVTEAGRLAITDEQGQVHDFATRRSEGERIAAVLRLAAVAYPSKVVALDARYWLALDEEHRAEFVRLATDVGLYVITEEPAEGELRLEHESAEVAA